MKQALTALYAGVITPGRSTFFTNESLVSAWVSIDLAKGELPNETPRVVFELLNRNGSSSLSNHGNGNFIKLEICEAIDSLELEFVKIGEFKELQSEDINISRFVFPIKAKLVLKINEKPQNFTIRMIGHYVNQSAYSHNCNLTFIASNETLIGGPETILPGEINDNLLLSNFWLERVKDIPFKIEVKVESEGSVVNNLKCDVSSKIPSPDLAKIWPDCIDSTNSRCQLVIELPDKIKDFSLNCELNGETKKESNIFLGNTKLVRKNSEGVLTKFETSANSLKFFGELWSTFPNAPKIFIVANDVLKLVEGTQANELNEPYVSWFSDTSDEMKCGALTWRQSNRFELTIPVNYFSRFPGAVKFAYYIEKSLHYFTGISNKLISHLVNEALEKKHPYFGNEIKVVSRKIYRNLSKASLVPGKSSFDYSEDFYANLAQYETHEIIAGFHNFSMTEGAPKVFYDIVKRLDSKQVRIVSPKDGAIGNELISLGFTVDIIKQLNIVGLTKSEYQKAFIESVEFFKKNKPKLLFLNSIDSFPLADIAWRLNIPIIWLIHESISPSMAFNSYPLWIRARYVKALTMASKVIFVSEETKKVYRTILSEGKTFVIKNGIDLVGFQTEIGKFQSEEIKLKLRSDEFNFTKNDIVFLSVGTTTERKGQDRTLTELSHLSKLEPTLNWKFIIVGGRELPYLDILKQKINDLDLADRVLIIPETTDVHQYYAIADYFILNSIEESSPLVILEAMAAGIPIFSTNVFGLKEILVDNNNSFLFDGNKEKDLAYKIRESISNRKLTAVVKQNALNQVGEKYDLSRTVTEYKEILSSFNTI